MALRAVVDQGAGGAIVNSVTGTANQVTASPTTGAVVLTLPAAVVMPGTLAMPVGSAFTPAQVAGIVGTTTNNDAAAGSNGEYISSTVPVSATTGLTSLAAYDVTSISLTAGDWNVWGVAGYNNAGSTTAQSFRGWISTTSATNPGAPNAGAYTFMNYTASIQNKIFPIGMMRISVAGTTTVYLSMIVDFTVSTSGPVGFIGARRIR